MWIRIDEKTKDLIIDRGSSKVMLSPYYHYYLVNPYDGNRGSSKAMLSPYC
jgi:hypothetical protein